MAVEGEVHLVAVVAEVHLVDAAAVLLADAAQVHLVDAAAVLLEAQAEEEYLEATKVRAPVLVLYLVPEYQWAEVLEVDIDSQGQAVEEVVDV